MDSRLCGSDVIWTFCEFINIPIAERSGAKFGQVFILQGNLPKAAQHYSEAVRIKPGYAEAHYKLGVVLVRQGDVSDEVQLY